YKVTGVQTCALPISARSGADHLVGFRADHGRYFPFSAWQAGGQLSGADPARIQFGWASTTGFDQQARQPVSAHAVGGSGARGGSLRSTVSFRVFAPL